MTSALKNFPVTNPLAATNPARARDELRINTLRFLAVDAVEQAKSGHPGLPLGAAPMAYVLWTRFLRHNPRDPSWPNRDRFILSPGHGCALLYALLHLTGYDLPVNELRRFRQWGSKTPGHPEYRLTPGVEVTTGPLGQGFAMGVGMALAEAHLAATFNTPEFRVIDHYTYAIVSDGDLMEGISSEAASFAGTVRLGKLIYLYDNNHISIEGTTDLAFTENVKERFEAYGWQVICVPDGEDLIAIDAAIRLAQAETSRPSLISVRNHIGYGSPKQDTAAAHGEPLGTDATKETKQKLGWPQQPTFYIPDEALEYFREAVTRGGAQQREWSELSGSYRRASPEMAAQLERSLRGELPTGWEVGLPIFHPDLKAVATRDASGKVMNVLAERVPELIGGSADLSPSTKTMLIGYGDMKFGKDVGRNLHFGIREHAMGGIVNGMALHGGIIPYGATFLIFSDYMRPALRLAALMCSRSIFVFTHDSIGLGEDGPTHQPVSQLLSLRSIPGLLVIRPADANETVAAWKIALQQHKPVALVFSRQKLHVLDPEKYPIANGVEHGAYVLVDSEAQPPQIVLIGTGSEVHLALDARERLAKESIHVRVVSMLSWELFDAQPAEYRNQVLPKDVPKLAIEAGVSLAWCRYVGENGGVIGLDRFGASAPGEVVMKKLGFNVDNVVTRARALLAGEHASCSGY
ncbi:MAG TPA: transketolase [Candidatus Angelobacter sp.]|nr:transketolase [Candidatus Angelobacter sp.]